ncbi:MAG: ribonuclease D [Sumerlaeia bacterium]
MIESDAQLSEICGQLAVSPILAFDTEFVGEKYYTPSLELIQLKDKSVKPPILVDVRALEDLSPLAQLFADPKILKVAHAASQDIPILMHYLGSKPQPLFDTQLAAAMVGMGAQISLKNLVRELTGAMLKSSQTVSDWSRRPLSPGQLQYAAEDVLYLHDLHEALCRRLDEMGRRSWFEEEQARWLESLTTAADVPDEDRYRNVREWARLSGQELAVLRELAAWRESEARAKNLPRRNVFPDEGLLALARTQPRSKDRARSLRQVPQGPLNRHLDAVLKAIARGKDTPEEQWPQKPKRPARANETPAGLVELFQALVRSVAEREAISPTLLATTDDLTTLAAKRHETETLDLPVLKGWRYEMIGKELLQLLHGEMCLRIRQRDHMVIEV